MDQFPSVAEADRIAACADPLVRNLQITQCYHELALALAARLDSHANWCTFATWASKQAGQTIRKEDLARAIEQAFAESFTRTPAMNQAAHRVALVARPGQAQQPALLQSTSLGVRQSAWVALDPLAAIDRASDAVARGNQKVFAEIGREFARFLATCLTDPACDDDNIARFCDALLPGDPPGGQRHLRHAFACYYRAFFEHDPKARAELLLLSNVEIGLHEQTRLQPEIAAALNAALVDPHRFMRRLLGDLYPYRGWLIYAMLRVLRWIGRPAQLDRAIHDLFMLAQAQLRQFLTANMMVLSLPGSVVLRLGNDLDAAFPPSLAQIANPELRMLLSQIARDPDSLAGTGASDWADLPQRLRFIAAFFRCYQMQPVLFDPPFMPDQVADLKTGRRPTGTL